MNIMLKNTSPRGMKNEMGGIPFRTEINRGYEEKITTVHISIGMNIAEAHGDACLSKLDIAENWHIHQSVYEGKTISSPML